MRHTGDIRLRLSGDTKEAQKYVSIARTFFGYIEQNHMGLGLLRSTKRAITLSSGVVITVWPNADQYHPLVEIYAPPKVSAGPTTLLASPIKWATEGIVITPRRFPDLFEGLGIAPDGKTLAAVDPDLLFSGAFPQRLLNYNHKENYPDAVFSATNPSGAPVLMLRTRAPFSGHNALFRDERLLEETDPRERVSSGTTWSDTLDVETGAVRIGSVQQYTPLMENVVAFNRSDTLVAHKAEFVEPDSIAARTVLEETNKLRGAEGWRRPLFPPLRQSYSWLADEIAKQANASGVMAHDSKEFELGFQTLVQRALAYGSPTSTTYSRIDADEDVTFRAGGDLGENLALIPRSRLEKDEPEEVGATFVSEWAASPGHLSNMLYAWGVSKYQFISGALPVGAAGVLQTNISVHDETIDRAAVDPADIDSELDGIEPVSGYFGAQVFVGVVSPFPCGDAYWYGDSYVLSWDSFCKPAHVPTMILSREAVDERNHVPQFENFVVFFRGNVVSDKYPIEGGAALIAAALIERDAQLAVRVAYVHAPKEWDSPPVLHVSDHLLFGAYGDPDRVVEHKTLELPVETAGVLGVFSGSGKKFTVSVHVREASPTDSFWEYDSNEDNFRTPVSDKYTYRPYPPSDEFPWQCFAPLENTSPTGYQAAIYGTSIRHSELNYGLWNHFPTQEVFVEPIETRTLRNETVDAADGSGGVHTALHGAIYHKEAHGEYDWLAAYDGETLRFLRMRLDFKQKQWCYWHHTSDDYEFLGDYYLHLKHTLVYPSGEEVKITHLQFSDRSAIDPEDPELGQFYRDKSFSNLSFPNMGFHYPADFGRNWSDGFAIIHTMDYVDPLDRSRLVLTEVTVSQDMEVFSAWGIDVPEDSTLTQPRIVATASQRTVVGDTEVLPTTTAYDKTWHDVWGVPIRSSIDPADGDPYPTSEQHLPTLYRFHSVYPATPVSVGGNPAEFYVVTNLLFPNVIMDYRYTVNRDYAGSMLRVCHSGSHYRSMDTPVVDADGMPSDPLSACLRPYHAVITPWALGLSYSQYVSKPVSASWPSPLSAARQRNYHIVPGAGYVHASTKEDVDRIERYATATPVEVSMTEHIADYKLAGFLPSTTFLRAQFVDYEANWVVAGHVPPIFGGYVYNTAVTLFDRDYQVVEPRYYFLSNVDLDAVVELGSMSQMIWPIGRV